MIEVYKDLSPSIFNELFNKRTLNYKLQYLSHFTILKVKSISDDSESIACLGLKFWNIIPSELK